LAATLSICCASWYASCGGDVVEIRLLGPVDVVAADRVVDVGPPQRRAVLAALAVDAGRQVTAEVLMDRVWGDAPPDGARRALHAQVTRLRRVLEAAGDGPAAIVRRTGGYVLDVDPALIDLHRFRLLVGRAREPGRSDVDRGRRAHPAPPGPRRPRRPDPPR
jgi:DNA-binding winged helix-turn-helix (wHTH) protein